MAEEVTVALLHKRYIRQDVSKKREIKSREKFLYLDQITNQSYRGISNNKLLYGGISNFLIFE